MVLGSDKAGRWKFTVSLSEKIKDHRAMAKLKLALIPPLKSIIKLGSNSKCIQTQPGEEVTQQELPAAVGSAAEQI